MAVTSYSKAGNRCFPFVEKFKVTSAFGPRSSFQTTNGNWSTSNHNGIDLVAVNYTGNNKIVCAAAGIVSVKSYNDARGYYVTIKTDDGYGNLYQHLKKGSTDHLEVGQRVEMRQQIGIEGSTGNVSGPHLHFEVFKWSDGKRFDPGQFWNLNNLNEVNGKIYDGAGDVTGYAVGEEELSADVSPFANLGEDAAFEDRYAAVFEKAYEGIQVTETNRITNSKLDAGKLYGRRYRILIQTSGLNALDVSSLRCVFEITKSMADRMRNVAWLKIYNLNPIHEASLIQNGSRLIIQAGYNGHFGTIFVGNVIQKIRAKEKGTDFVLKLVCMDTYVFSYYSTVGFTAVANQSMRDCTRQLVSKSTYPAKEGTIANTNLTYPRGKVMFGMSRDYLAQIAKTNNNLLYQENGGINLVSVENTSRTYATELNAKTGLVGYPSQNEYGVTCTMLLNPGITLNSLVHINSRLVIGRQFSPGSDIPVRALDVDGLYKIITLTHSGDTRGEEWYTEIDAISQAGLTPDNAYTANTAIYN